MSSVNFTEEIDILNMSKEEILELMEKVRNEIYRLKSFNQRLKDRLTSILKDEELMNKYPNGIQVEELIRLQELGLLPKQVKINQVYELGVIQNGDNQNNVEGNMV